MKIVAVNNYKEDTKAVEVLHNLNNCSGQRVEMVDYKTRDLQSHITNMEPDVVVLTGSNYMLSKSDTKIVFEVEMDLVRNLDVPFLGICFGHQLIGAAYGVTVADLGQSIRAFKEIKLLTRDAVFEGLPDSIKVSESHRQALIEVPKGFRHLAESATSRVEAIAHESRPIYGFQFHPERSDEKNPHGRSIIQNFLKLVSKS